MSGRSPTFSMLQRSQPSGKAAEFAAQVGAWADGVIILVVLSALVTPLFA